MVFSLLHRAIDRCLCVCIRLSIDLFFFSVLLLRAAAAAVRVDVQRLWLDVLISFRVCFVVVEPLLKGNLRLCGLVRRRQCQLCAAVTGVLLRRTFCVVGSLRFCLLLLISHR